jgi:hypothetical protein
MKQTSRMSRSRSVHGSRPSTLQLALEGREAEDRVERGGLAGAVRADEPEDAALLDAQVDAVQRDGRAEGLAQAAGFDAGMASALLSRRFAARRGTRSAARPGQPEALDGRVDPRPLLRRNLWRSPCSSRRARPR